MKRWLAFLIAAIVVALIHEGTHAIMAAMYHELDAFQAHLFGLEVIYKTPPAERQGIHWAYISGASNLATLTLGYLLLSLGRRLAQTRPIFLKAVAFYLTLLALLADPFNLSLGAFIYGGDANGIAVGLGVNRYLIQAVSFVVLLTNRELIAQRLFPLYNVRVSFFLFQPWFRTRAEST